jgi:uroporphyrin-III C-methyltransferase
VTAASRPESGRVSVVGAGPGDRELLTLRAARLIDEADDLVVDALVPPDLYRDSPARVVYVGKRAGRPHASQARIGEILVDLAGRGRRVVRLKGGDPSVFGRLGEEIRALEEAGIDYEVVPGVSSFQAAAVAAGAPLTERNVADRFLVMTGHGRAGAPALPELPSYDERTTVVWLMPLGNLERLVQRALALGYPHDLPAVAVSSASLEVESRVAAPLAALAQRVAEQGLETPVTVIVGRVAEGVVGVARERAAGLVESGA